jgi:hypothetical protein
MSDEDLEMLTDEQLEERVTAAEISLREAQRAYDRQTGNLGDNPQGHIPTSPAAKLSELDAAVQSAERTLNAINSELQRRRRSLYESA